MTEDAMAVVSWFGLAGVHCILFGSIQRELAIATLLALPFLVRVVLHVRGLICFLLPSVLLMGSM